LDAKSVLPSQAKVTEHFMNLKKALPLGAALILGLISARLVVQMMHKKPAEAVVTGPKMVDVVVAHADLTAGEELNTDNVVATQLPSNTVPAGSFSDPSELVGRVAAVSMVKNQTVVESMLARKGSPSGLQAVIPVGMRAVTIDINETSGVAGYVTPGCRVDVLQTLHDQVSNDLLGRAIAQSVPVLAVGARPTGSITNDQPQEGHSVTLLVTPRQAELIELASTNGHPRLVLRGADDQKISDVPPVTLTELTSDLAREPARPVIDPFAAPLSTPATRPSSAEVTMPVLPVTPEWRMKVITGGEVGQVNVIMPASANGQPSISGTETKEVTSP
jgi:pilus assembly protein CpaB